VHTPEIDRSPQLISHVLSGLGWKSDDLEAFGVSVRYPMLHTRLVLSVGET
jgi:hypothetical protein